MNILRLVVNVVLLSFFFASCSGPELKSDQMKKSCEKIDQSLVRQPQVQGHGDYSFQLTHKGVQRFYNLHVPPSYLNKKRPLPLMIALHGGGGDMVLMGKDKYFRLNTKADQENFIVVYPNGYAACDLIRATWNAGKCCGESRDNNIDDVGFLKAMIEKISKDFMIDQKKIFAAGMSNGGMMSYRLACELPEMFAGVASIAGTDETKVCRPKKAIDILHIHAMDDDHSLFYGGRGNVFKDPSVVTNFISVPDTIQLWVKHNHCHEKPIRILEKKNVWCDRYTGCDNNSRVQLCVTQNGGHSWPGGEKIPNPKMGIPSLDLSAVDVIWDFFNHK